MKIFRKTYGVRNLVEWQANIPVGKGRLVVHFTRGAITAYGVTPATFRTENPAIQAAIENSAYFNSGRIFLQKSEFLKEVKSAPIPAPKVETPATAAEVPAKAAESETSAGTEETSPAPSGETVEETTTAGTAAEEPTGEGEGEKADEGEVNATSVSEPDEDGFVTIDVTCTEDARQYLITKFGFTASAVRTKALINQKAAANKIKFTVNGSPLV